MKKIIGTIPEPEKNINELTDNELMKLIKHNLSIGTRYPKGMLTVYKRLNLKRAKSPKDREKEKSRLQRFFKWETSADTIIIKEIYDTPISISESASQPSQPSQVKYYRRFNDYKGYIEDDEFLTRISNRLCEQQEYKGYKEICDILSINPQKGANIRKQQDDWHRFFNWEVISQRKWLITEIYDIPRLSDEKETHSVYASDSSKLLAKRLYNDSPYLQNIRLGIPAEDHSMDIMIKRDNVARIMGLNNELLTKNELLHDDNGKLEVISKFVKKFDTELYEKQIEHTEKDLITFRDQMSRKFRSVMEAGLTDLKNKGIIVRYLYTELYYNIHTKNYGALFEKPYLDIEVSEYKTMFMRRYGIYDWKYFSKLNLGQRIALMRELNAQLEQDLGIKISYGYWIRLNLHMLEKFYSKENIELIDEKKTKSNLKEILRQRQEISARDKADQIQAIYDEGNGYMTQHSNNYIKVSSELFDSVFKADENIKNLGHLYLSVDRL